MKKTIFIAVTFVTLFANIAVASDYMREHISVLSGNSFVRIEEPADGEKIIQLYVVENGKIDLVDAIEVNEKTVSFHPLFEVRHLKIEQKD